MNDDELARLLGDAFDQRARAAVGDDVSPPPPRFASDAAAGAVPRNSWRRRWWAPVIAAAAVVAAVGVVATVTRGGSRSVAGPAPSPTPSPLSSFTAPAGAIPVRATVARRPTVTVGVGLPVIVAFSRAITDGRALQAATRVTADGRPLPVAWYFERGSGGSMTAHLRPRTYWPAHARIQVEVASAGLSAGRGLAFADDVRVVFRTAAARVAIVDGVTHRMTVAEDGRPVGTFPVSLGTDATPTTRGIKVIMTKGDRICVDGPGYHLCNVRFTQRLTSSGEFLLSAPWTIWASGKQNVSNGSTDLQPVDAARLYRLLQVGDVLDYRNCHGPMMTAAQGYGDWNVPWATWLTGGLVPTS